MFTKAACARVIVQNESLSRQRVSLTSGCPSMAHAAWKDRSHRDEDEGDKEHHDHVGKQRCKKCDLLGWAGRKTASGNRLETEVISLRFH